MTGLRERNRRAAMGDVQRVAMRMMQESGFANVTVEEVAATSGVSPSTVYRYFGTKEALVLWGDRAGQMVAEFTAAKVGKKRSAEQAFIEAAIATYDDVDAVAHLEFVAQLELIFANEDLTIAFEHELIGRRDDVAAALATHRSAKSVSGRDAAQAGALLGALIAVLERWQTSGGEKSLAKQLSKAFDAVS
jgi:AcrR family transcriptional regulator